MGDGFQGLEALAQGRDLCLDVFDRALEGGAGYRPCGRVWPQRGGERGLREPVVGVRGVEYGRGGRELGLRVGELADVGAAWIWG